MRATYRKIVIHRLSGEFRSSTRIVDTAWIEPGQGQVVIRNRYVGCNAFFDQALCANRIPYVQVIPPFDMGVEAVGEIVAAGADVRGLRPGDAVATTRLGTGYREYQLADAARVHRIREVSPEILTLIPTGVSALVGLERVAELRTGETVAVSAAAGGLGHLVVQLARRAGNHVIGITSSEDKAALLQQIGCDRIVNRRQECLRNVLGREYPAGLDIAWDSVGGEVFDVFLEHLAVRGRLVVAGHSSDFQGLPDPVLRPRIYHELYWKSASVRGFQNPSFPEAFEDAVRRLLDLHARGEIHPVVDPTPFRGLESVPDAVEHLLSGASRGKVVVQLE